MTTTPKDPQSTRSKSEHKRLSALGAEVAQPTPGEDDLLPCPFCGRSPIFTADDSYGHCAVTCNCELEPGVFRGKDRPDDAISAWNRRAPSHTRHPLDEPESLEATPDTDAGRYWCKSHQREATHKINDRHVCDPSLGGITLPCFVVFLEYVQMEP